MATARPMCWAWYERAGDYRPWHFHAEGCTCGMNAHALPGQHATACPVNPEHDAELLAQLTGPGDAER